MFQHAIVVCVSPSPAGFWKLQQHLSEAGPKHLGTKLLLFPDHESAAAAVLGMCPMLMDAARRRGQQKYASRALSLSPCKVTLCIYIYVCLYVYVTTSLAVSPLS
jgi:hypothetical protein